MNLGKIQTCDPQHLATNKSQQLNSHNSEKFILIVLRVLFYLDSKKKKKKGEHELKNSIDNGNNDY